MRAHNAPRGAGAPRSEPLQQPLQILKLHRRPAGLTQSAAQLLEDLPRPLHVDLVWYLHRAAHIRTVGLLRWASEGVELGAAARAVARRHLAQHLLGHVARALAQLLQRSGLLIRALCEIAVA